MSDSSHQTPHKCKKSRELSAGNYRLILIHFCLFSTFPVVSNNFMSHVIDTHEVANHSSTFCCTCQSSFACQPQVTMNDVIAAERVFGTLGHIAATETPRCRLLLLLEESR